MSFENGVGFLWLLRDVYRQARTQPDFYAVGVHLSEIFDVFSNSESGKL